MLNVRVPASLSDGDCRSWVKAFLPHRYSRAFSHFKTLKDIGRDYPFDFDEFNRLKTQYISHIKKNGAESLEPDRSAEGVLAFAESLNHKNHMELGPGLEHLTWRKRRVINKLTERINSDKPLSVEDLEDLVAELYATILGPAFKVSELALISGNNGKKRLLFRLMAEDVTVNGLSQLIKKYKLIKGPSALSKLSHFLETKKGKALSAGLFSLPVLWGIPLIYLPGLKRIKIPPKLAKEALENGLDDQMIKKMVKGINENLKGSGSLSLDTQAKYRIFRRYYMYGTGAIIVYIMYTDFRQADQYRVENEVYEEAIDDMTQTIDSALVLKERGFDIFKTDEREPEEGVLSNSFCRAIRDCLESEKESLGHTPLKGSESYQACKEFMDPMNKCPRL